jgi:hypothetical protein
LPGHFLRYAHLVLRSGLTGPRFQLPTYQIHPVFIPPQNFKPTAPPSLCDNRAGEKLQRICKIFVRFSFEELLRQPAAKVTGNFFGCVGNT